MGLRAALQSLADSPAAVVDKRHRGTLRLPMTHPALRRHEVGGKKCLVLLNSGDKLVLLADTSRVAPVRICQTMMGGGVGA